MLIKAVKQKLQRQKEEELQRIREIEAQAQRFEQSVIEAMESLDQDLDHEYKPESGNS